MVESEKFPEGRAPREQFQVAFLLTEAAIGAAAVSAEGESAACTNSSHNALEFILVEQADGFAAEAELLGQGAILHSRSSF